MNEILFNTPIWLFVLLGVIELILIGMRVKTEKPKWIFLAIAPVLAGVLFGLDAMVETDQERLEIVVQEITDDFLAGRFEAMAERISPDYSGFKGQRDAMFKELRFRKKNVVDVKLSNIETEVSGKYAKMDVTTSVDFRSQTVTAKIRLDWKVDWAKYPDGWKITHITLLTKFPGL